MGVPQFSYDFYGFTAPDSAVPYRMQRLDPRQYNDAERQHLTASVLARYRRNLHLINAVAERVGVHTLFIAHPIPYFAYPINRPSVYPFELDDHKAANKYFSVGYSRFKELADDGSFGPRFHWNGNVFNDASQPMYIDRVHYSPAGANLLAEEMAKILIASGIEWNRQ